MRKFRKRGFLLLLFCPIFAGIFSFAPALADESAYFITEVTDEIPTQNYVMATLAETKRQTIGYGSGDNFLAPIQTSDPDAIKIYTAQDLNNVRNSPSGSYVLMNDIDLADYNSGQWEPICNYNITTNYSISFTGTFDGQGHVIENLQISGGDYRYSGLFGYIKNATVKNLGLKDTEMDISSFGSAGALCGYADDSKIDNCYNTGDIISSSSTGGILGHSDGSSISNCYNLGNISTYMVSAGGICSYSVDTEIANCYNMGIITSTNIFSGSCNAGGISGANRDTVRIIV